LAVELPGRVPLLGELGDEPAKADLLDEHGEDVTDPGCRG